jgi:hypothetical protein
MARARGRPPSARHSNGALGEGKHVEDADNGRGTGSATLASMTPKHILDSTVDRILMLPEAVASTDVADDCREAALKFMNDSPKWNRSGFEAWLSGPYAEISAYLGKRASDWRPVPLVRELDARMMTRILRSTYVEVRAALSQVDSDDGIPPFAMAMSAGGFVTPCEDEYGRRGFLPSGSARRLADIVLSLFAADYLARARDYSTALAFCDQCQSMAFDVGSRTRGHCGRHVSMFAPRRAKGASYLPEGA